MKFKEFLSAAKAKNDRSGDFVRLAKSDPNLPDAVSWEEMRRYIDLDHQNPRITDAGRTVWSAYQKSERKARRDYDSTSVERLNDGLHTTG